MYVTTARDAADQTEEGLSIFCVTNFSNKFGIISKLEQ